MSGKGASVSHFQSRPFSGRKTLKKCRSNVEDDDIVLIDVDSDVFNNIIIIDVPESLKKKRRGSTGLGKEKNCPSMPVIFIEDDESTDNRQPGIGLEGGKFYTGASSSMKFGPSSSSHTRHPVNAVGGHQFAHENISPVKLSKCKRTYSGKAFSNHYGLNSDSDSSDNDATDCEFMEDSSGKLQEQWEKAKLKRQSDVCNAQSGKQDQGSASRPSNEAHQEKAPVSSIPNKGSCAKDDQSPSVSTVIKSRSPSCNPLGSSFTDIDFNSTEKVGIHQKNAGIPLSTESSRKSPFCSKTEQQKDKVFEKGGSCIWNDGKNEEASSSSPSNQHSRRQDRCREEERTPQAEPTSNLDPSSCHGKASLRNDKGLCEDHCSVDQCSLKQNKISDPKESLHEDTPLSDDELFNHLLSPISEDIRLFFKASFSSEYSSMGKPGISPEMNICPGGSNLVRKASSFCNIHLDETHLKQINSLEVEEARMKLVSNCRKDERNDLLHASDGDAGLVVESFIFNEREKLKETDEYKRALEEEWLSRQKALKIQAEEAQHLRRLRKRERAESLRLLDMEKRQKQRVEEIRETQKKVEETMNMKELHRAEVRKELNKLETTCRDMASLLRGLGIQVGGGLLPSLHEVRTAYKRALLSFHPDRASGSDVREQVEAEEKFKLISRMKEKFLPSS